ncbi:MAG: flavin reductase family protein [Candidatus Eremiobacteraeota bacterium]|nr:flavin reductase family protein [Candidatus Eremiobacteraeota bacterium]MBV8354038.1 flavin reductase family protein [Candidatus Eremiobacteraeota bacterium]
MRRFPTGVTIVTTVHEGVPYGFTANAFTSVSIDPPTILICVNREASSHPIIAQSGIFCVNILSNDQVEIAQRFADKSARGDRFAGLPTHALLTGAPVIDGALAYVDCRLSEEHSAGTHTVFLGEVVASGAQSGAPLGYFNAGYRDFGVTV